MSDKLELLKRYYAEHPEWEKRRYEVLKDLVAAKYCASAITRALHNDRQDYMGKIGDLQLIKKEVDKTLASINPEIEELRKVFTYRVCFKVTPEALEDKLYQVQEIGSYQNPPKIEEIIAAYNRAGFNNGCDPSNYTLDDFEITEIE